MSSWLKPKTVSASGDNLVGLTGLEPVTLWLRIRTEAAYRRTDAVAALKIKLPRLRVAPRPWQRYEVARHLADYCPRRVRNVLPESGWASQEEIWQRAL
jgi:hypothetical protein